MRSPKGDDLWLSGDVAAMRSFPVSLRPDGSRSFLREGDTLLIFFYRYSLKLACLSFS